MEKTSQAPECQTRTFGEIAFDIVLKAFLVTSLFFYVPGQLAYAPQEAFVQYSIIILFSLSFFIPPKRQVSNVWIGLILLYGVITTIFMAYDEVSRYALMNLFLGCLLLKTLAERVDFNFKSVGYWFMGFTAANLFLMSLQLVNYDPIFTSLNFGKMPQSDVVGFMGIRFALGAMGAMILPFIFSVNPIYTIAVLPLLYYSKSSTCVLAGVLSLLFLMWFKHRKMFWISLALLGSVAIYYIGFVDGPSGQFMKRIHTWWTSMTIFKVKPWFGYGLGKWKQINFVGIQENGIPEKWEWAHSEWIQYLFEQGLIGAGILYCYMKNLFKNFVFNENGRIIFASMISFIIIASFHFPVHVGRFAGLSIYILALMEAHRIDQEKIKFFGIGRNYL